VCKDEAIEVASKTPLKKQKILCKRIGKMLGLIFNRL
jgi:hypothetical protein